MFDFSSPRASTLSPRTTTAVGSNGLSSSGLSTSISGGGVVAPGPVGSAAPAIPANTNTSINGLFGFVSRPDLCYQNIATLQNYLKQTKTVMDALNKAISTLSEKDSAHYSCLLCKQKGKQIETKIDFAGQLT